MPAPDRPTPHVRDTRVVNFINGLVGYYTDLEIDQLLQDVATGDLDLSDYLTIAQADGTYARIKDIAGATCLSIKADLRELPIEVKHSLRTKDLIVQVRNAEFQIVGADVSFPDDATIKVEGIDEGGPFTLVALTAGALTPMPGELPDPPAPLPQFPKGAPGQILSMNDQGEYTWVDAYTPSEAPAVAVSGVTAGPIPAAEWVSYTPLQVDTNVGSWDVDGGVFIVPESGQYAVSGQVIIVPKETNTPADVFLRLAVSTGIVSGSSLRVTSPSTVVKFEDTVRLEKGDRVQVQLYSDAAFLSVSGAGATLSMRLVAPANRMVRPLWENPPLPFSMAVTEATTQKPRSIELYVPDQNLGANAYRKVGFAGFGGAAPTLNTSDPTSVNVGSEVGRLLRVEGKLPAATSMRLQQGGNGYISSSVYNATGKNPAGLQLLPNIIDAKTTATRSTFDGKSGGSVAFPGHIYIRDTRASVSLNAAGPDTPGGKITLTDVTPHDFIGDIITVKARKAEAGTGVTWESTSSGIIPTWDESNYYGAGFAISNLPKGNYRVTGKVRVVGAHDNYRLMQAWNMYPKDGAGAIIPTRRVLVQADGKETEQWPGYVSQNYSTTVNNFTVDYYFDTYITRDLATWCGLLQSITGVNGAALTVDGELRIERVAAGSPFYSYVMEFDESTLTSTAAFYPTLRNKEQENIGRVLLNGGVSWSGYGGGSGSQSDLTGTVWASNNRWSFRREKWTFDVYCTDGAVTNLNLLNRRVNTNMTSSGIRNLGGGHYQWDMLTGGTGSPLDGGLTENFGVASLQGVAGTKVKGTVTVSQVEDWIGPMEG